MLQVLHQQVKLGRSQFTMTSRAFKKLRLTKSIYYFPVTNDTLIYANLTHLQDVTPAKSSHLSTTSPTPVCLCWEALLDALCTLV